MPSSNQPSREEIAKLAYFIFEKEGRPHGRNVEHWLQAEAMLQTSTLEKAAQPKATKPAPTAPTKSPKAAPAFASR